MTAYDNDNRGGYRDGNRGCKGGICSYGAYGEDRDIRGGEHGNSRSSNDRGYSRGGSRGGYSKGGNCGCRQYERSSNRGGNRTYDSDRQDDRRNERSSRGGSRTYSTDRDTISATRDTGVSDTRTADNRGDELPNLIMGRNAVKEAIKTGRSIDKLLVSTEQDGSLREIISLARDINLIIKEVPKTKLDELCMPFGHGGRTGNHQGVVAFIPGAEYCDISDILDYAREKNEKPFVILLDSIEDPHNLGSIIRSAVCAGAHGVIITKRRSASLTAAATKASAGAVMHMIVARVANLTGAIERLKDEGLWIAGADMSGKPMYECDMKGAIGLVIGSEGEGISRLVKESCDYLVSIPMVGELNSLNASVAAGILMYEKKRQDR